MRRLLQRLRGRRHSAAPLTIEDVLKQHEEYVQAWIDYQRQRYMNVFEDGEWIAYERPPKPERFWTKWRVMKDHPHMVDYKPVSSPFKGIAERAHPDTIAWDVPDTMPKDWAV